MTLKKKKELPINTESSISDKCFQHIFAHNSSEGSSYNTPARNNGGWFPKSNKSYIKHSLKHVTFLNLIFKF